MSQSVKGRVGKWGQGSRKEPAHGEPCSKCFRSSDVILKGLKPLKGSEQGNDMITFEFQINHPDSNVKDASVWAKLECGAGEVGTKQKVKGMSRKLGLIIPGNKHCWFLLAFMYLPRWGAGRLAMWKDGRGGLDTRTWLVHSGLLRITQDNDCSHYPADYDTEGEQNNVWAGPRQNLAWGFFKVSRGRKESREKSTPTPRQICFCTWWI